MTQMFPSAADNVDPGENLGQICCKHAFTLRFPAGNFDSKGFYVTDSRLKIAFSRQGRLQLTIVHQTRYSKLDTQQRKTAQNTVQRGVTLIARVDPGLLFTRNELNLFVVLSLVPHAGSSAELP